MSDLRQAIAKNIAELRAERSMTQAQLAEKLNYSDKAVSKWERAESVPDVCVLKEIADLFDVSVDYLLQSEHVKKTDEDIPVGRLTRNNRIFITGMCIVLVWLVATFAFVVVDASPLGTNLHWLAFVYAVPVSMVVWLVFNSIWFDQHRNFLIISILMWSALGSVFLSFLPFGIILWQIFVLGIPGQIIICFWSRIKVKK
ncbi:MAG: helix-turn-helix transcriptional regulator [Clostridia bacterium]|nr:helix-turn-helix transcriptional regulator [Clostridia bacterium]